MVFLLTLFKQNANHEQKSMFLPKACTGEYLCGMGMTEPDAGTDVLGEKNDEYLETKLFKYDSESKTVILFLYICV